MDSGSPQEKEIERLYKEMYPVLFAYAKNVLQKLPLSEEAVQDTFCIACTKSDSFLQSGNPKGWLMATLKFVIRNTMRQWSKIENLRTLSLNSEESVLLITYDEGNIDVLYENLAAREDFQLFKKIVLDHYSMREAAEEFGITVEACKKRVQRLRTFLRKNFFEDE